MVKCKCSVSGFLPCEEKQCVRRRPGRVHQQWLGMGGVLFVAQVSHNPVNNIRVFNTSNDPDSPIVAAVVTTVRFLNSQPVCHSPGILRLRIPCW